MEKTCSFISFILNFSFFNFMLLPSVISAALSITTDKDALLSFKAHIIEDPKNLLASNWLQNTSVCNWIGVSCGRRHQRVIALNISHSGLTGTIPPQIGNISFLIDLDITNNSFHGSIPDELGHLHRLEYVDLSDNQFSGSIPTSIFNLSSLQMLYLSNNYLLGTIPSISFNNMSSLEKLSLSNNKLSGSFPWIANHMSSLKFIDFNDNRLSGGLPPSVFSHLPNLKVIYLTGNNFSGDIPAALFKCKQLQDLSLSQNKFSGVIPKEIGNLTKLKELYLGINVFQGEIPQELGNLAELMILSVVENQLSGAIPKEVGNMTKLKELYLDGNKLQGEIPYEISTLPIIEFLTLGSNYLGGIVPPWIFNISTLKLLDLTYDKPSHRHGQLSGKFSGILPVSIGVGLPNLEELYLGNNSFSGIIPRSITNITKLSVLELSSNSFTGSIPSTIGSLGNLTWLNLSDNDLTSAPDLSFLLSLTSCKSLKNLFLSENRLTGILPSFIGNFSITLEVFDVEGCYFKGRIPKQISNLKSLTTINLGSNELTGSIPDTFGQLHNLQGLYLYNNKLEGFVPKSLCRLHRLAYLDMKSNNLSGSIPSCLSSLTSLREIDLSNNGFSSTIPTTLWNLKYVLHLNLSSNSLIGHVSSEIGNLNVVLSIDLSRNHLSGSIPTTIGGLRDLQHLSLGSNRLEGSIPKSIGEIVALESLDLLSNNIFGIIPKSLEALHLKYLNLSFNRLEGEIPTGRYFANFSAESFMGNPALCGLLPRGIPSCHRKGHKKSRIVIVILSITLPLAFVLAFTLVLIKFRQKRIRKLPNDTESSSSIGTWRRISYWEVLQATDGFDECNMLGSGSLGSVYKGRLPDGLEIAVKVFNLELEEAVKSFDVECEVLSKIRHRNLVQVISSCSNEDFKALILKYMPNGSLEKCLYSHNYFLNIFQRLNIMIDVASALEYLHFENSTLIVHCDLKPSNVLIDENMVGHLSDFGIAKLLGEESMQQTQILATIGYMAPEYGREGQVSRKCDVYSFGIMLMETFTRKKPTDKCFDGEISLKSWVYNSLHSAVTKIVDANLLKEEDEHFAAKEDIVSSILSLAIDCTEMLPEKRVDTRYVVNRLIKIRAKLLDEVGRGQCSKETI